MENIKLIVDSSANMNNDPARNLEVVPLTISFLVLASLWGIFEML